MLIRTPREVGLLIRDQRRAKRITQAELAQRVGSSREWIRFLESGKPRLELGLTLRALSALGISLDANIEELGSPAVLLQTSKPASARARKH